MSMWAYFSWGLWASVVAAAWTFRSRPYAIYRAVTLAIHTLVVLSLLRHVGVMRPVYLYLHALVFIDAVLLIVPRLRPTWYRVLLSLPAQYMMASTFMAFPWAIVSAFGVKPWGFELPYVLGVIGLVQSLSTRREQRTVMVGDVESVSDLVRIKELSPEESGLVRRLRIAQITDPHLGPFMPVARLRAICERIVGEQ